MQSSNVIRSRLRPDGFTLIELMITIVVIAVIATLAAPSFNQMRERQITRGAAENVVSQVANFRMEAVRRNRPVTISSGGSGTGWCVGAAVGATSAACNCESADQVCDVGIYPSPGSNDLRGARLVTPLTAFTVDPSTGTLDPLGTTARIVVEAPTDRYGYELQVDVNPMGRTTICVPSDATAMPGVQPCA